MSPTSYRTAPPRVSGRDCLTSNGSIVPRIRSQVNSRRRSRTASARGSGRGNVADNEQLLAGPDQAKLATGKVLDGGRVFLQPADLFADPRVHALGACDVGFPRGGLSLPAH